MIVKLVFYLHLERWELSGTTADCFDIDTQSYPGSWTSSSWSGSGWGTGRQREQCDISQVLPECRQPFSPLRRQYHQWILQDAQEKTRFFCRQAKARFNIHPLCETGTDGYTCRYSCSPGVQMTCADLCTDFTAKLCSWSSDFRLSWGLFWGDLRVLQAVPKGCFWKCGASIKYSTTQHRIISAVCYRTSA